MYLLVSSLCSVRGRQQHGSVIFMRSSLKALLSKPALGIETGIVRCLWSGVF